MLKSSSSYPTYNTKLKLRARALRKNSTLGETLLWKKLQRKQLLGYQFFRQKPIGYYIVDLYCPTLKLVIEVDGFSHDFKMENDQCRTDYLAGLGLYVLRFQEKQVRQDIENIIQIIVDWIEANKPTSP